MKNIFLWSLNPKKYKYLINEKFSKAFLYLVILCIILGVVNVIPFISGVSSAQKIIKEKIADGTIDFQIKDSILTVKSSPLKLEFDGQSIIYIDTDKTIADADSLRSITVHKEVSVTVLKDGVIVKSGSNHIENKYADLGLTTFNSNQLVNYVDKINIVKYIAPIFLIIVNVLKFLIYGLMITFAGALSLLFNKQKIAYKQVFKLAIFALTIPILISLVISIGKYSILVGGVILVLGLNNCIENKVYS